jgi:hypothetical protein
MGLGRTLAKWGMLVLLALAPMMPASAQEATPQAVVSEPWQEVITLQIEAFRTKDAPGAFTYAAEAFHAGFPSAEAFFVAIVGSGYAPIMESRSHSFGAFQKVSDTVVVQQVKFVGEDQGLYEAIYQLTAETAGWRVSGVQLVKQPGIGI